MGATGTNTAVIMKCKMVTFETKHDAVRAMEKGTAQIQKIAVPRNTLYAWIKKVKEIKKS